MKHASFSIGNHRVYMLHLEPDHLKVTLTCYRRQSRKFAKLASLPSYAIFVYLSICHYAGSSWLLTGFLRYQRGEQGILSSCGAHFFH